MGKRYIDSGVLCPYYCSEEPSKIYCEGIEAGNWVHLAWMDGKKKKEYKHDVCRGAWEQCPLARMHEEE